MDAKAEGRIETDIKYIKSSITEIKDTMKSFANNNNGEHAEIIKAVENHQVRISNGEKDISILFSRYQKILFSTLGAMISLLLYLLSKVL